MRLWKFAGASAIGSSHAYHDTSLQDAYAIHTWTENWGIVIVSDGAGSAKYAEIASQKCAHEYAPDAFLHALGSYIYAPENPLTDALWRVQAHKALRSIHEQIVAYATAQNHDPYDYLATIIVVVYTPYGLFLCHVGDGRACYRDSGGAWHAMMKPYNPDPMNTSVTCFIVEDHIFEEGSECIEYRHIAEATAFALMSDGCESYTYTLTPVDPETGALQNIPFTGFFEHLYAHFTASDQSHDERSADLHELLSQNPRFKDESDDKTLVVAYLQ